MNKQQAIALFQKHVDWCALLQDKIPVDVSKEENPNNVWCGVSKQDSQLYEEFCKENGTIEFDFDEEGGVGCGDYIMAVHKLTHPVHGEVYLQYEGDYDSWSGTEWGCHNNPQFVKPVNRIVEVTDWVGNHCANRVQYYQN